MVTGREEYWLVTGDRKGGTRALNPVMEARWEEG